MSIHFVNQGFLSICQIISREEPEVSSPKVTPSQNARQVKRTVNFEDLAIFRGTALDKVLRGGGYILGDAPPTEDYYDLSECASNRLDAFISHNWATSRGEKFLALVLHFNLRLAIAAAAAASCLAFVLTTLRVLPVVPSVVNHESGSQSIWCQVFGVAAFLLALFFGRQFLGRLGCGGPLVFLDKTCVHQTDEELKLKGIRNLAAFLSNSSTAVVLYSDLYLRKLWTVYELATFLLLYPTTSRLLVQPVFLPRVVLVAMGIICLSRCFYTVLYMPWVHLLVHEMIGLEKWCIFIHDWMLLELLIFMPSVSALVAVLRRWMRHRARIYTHVEAFSIYNADCLNEEDRGIVEGNVAAFARHFGLVDPYAPKSVAMGAFDELVHEKVPEVLNKSLGRAGVPYKYATLIFSVYIPYTMDTWASRIVSRPGTLSRTSIAIDGLGYALVVFGIGPICIATCSRLAELSLQLRGTVRMLFYIFINASTLVAYYGLWMLNIHFVNAAEESYNGVVGFLAFAIIVLMLTLALYRQSVAPRYVVADASSDEGSNGTSQEDRWTDFDGSD